MAAAHTLVGMSDAYCQISVTITPDSFVSLEQIVMWLPHNSRAWRSTLKHYGTPVFGTAGNVRYLAKDVHTLYLKLDGNIREYKKDDPPPRRLPDDPE